MNVACLGINHRTAPVEIREKIWFSADEVRSTLPLLKEKYASECVLISTCNRTELYYTPRESALNGIPLWKILAGVKKTEALVTADHFYSLSSLHAVKHLFKVAAGIDSMVLGDVQILGQVKEAFTLSQETATTGVVLNRLFHTALHAGKRARSETEIGEGAVSVSYAAAELATKIFEDLSRRTALLIGAGETGELAARHLCSRSLGKLLVTNRTLERAEGLAAELGGRAIPFDTFRDELRTVDIVISSVTAPTYVLTTADLAQIVKSRGSKPLFLIDIGVPRNIDPAANRLGNIFLHDIDSLNHIIDINLAHRHAEMPKVQSIIYDELVQFHHWYSSLEVTPTIQQLREQFEEIRRAEVERAHHRFKDGTQEEIDILTKRIVNKILHTPMVNLKSGTNGEAENEIRTKIHLIRHLFGLDKKTPE